VEGVQRLKMTSWPDLETQFSELHEYFASLGGRIDRTWGEGRADQWRIAGGVGTIHQSRFTSLSVLAGRLVETLPDGLAADAVVSEQDPFRRWMLAIWAFGQPSLQYGTQRAADGTESILLFGSLELPAAVAANLCLHYSAHTLPIASRLEQELLAPRYLAVRGHWQRAHDFLSAVTPDYPNAAKEAVSAVEALAQIVVRRSSATFGECIKELRASGAVKQPILKGLEELWGFTNSSPGVRHGSAATPTLSPAECAYVLDQAAGTLRLLLSLDRAA
jgi:hypothetical protein